jgi:DNA-binding transcriptional MerR regulator
MSSRDYLTIGEVVQRLVPTFPDLSISKVRFLEDEGLICPERTQGGYRKFAMTDVARIEMILTLQRDYFYPLAVIREKLAEIDRGRVPVELQNTGTAVAPVISTLSADGPVLLENLQADFGVPESFARELAGFGVVVVEETDAGEALSRDDLPALHAAWDLRRFGVEPRHLRMYGTFADREAALFSQILMPSFRHKTPESRKKLAETLSELGSLTDQLKGRLLRRALSRAFEDVT